jgi:cytoskeletal protein CcmA (bactofilin family)
MDDRPAPDQTRIPSTLFVNGDLAATQDIVIDGRFDGHITVPDHHLSIGSSASVKAKIIARSVSIFGSVDGQIQASERVELLASASVRGHVVTPSILVMDGAQFTGSIDPERSEAAIHVARYRQRHTQ